LVITTCILGAWFLYFLPQILSSTVPYYRDQLLTIIPLRQYIRTRLLQFQLPQWYPFEGLGVPFIGQVATATFHPQNLLFLPFSAATTVKLNTLGAYLVGAWGAYAFGRKAGSSRPGALSGSFAFGFGGYALGISNNLVYLVGLVTLPWVAWASMRLVASCRGRDCGVLAAIWGSMFLAGDAQMFLCASLLVAAAFFLGRPRLRAGLLIAASVALATLLISAELLPALSVGARSLRELGTPSARLGLIRALHPLRLPGLVIPGYIPDAYRYRLVGEVLDGDSAVWSTTIFAGALTLMLAAAGLKSRRRSAVAFGAVSLFGIWMALGDRGGLLPLLAHLAPVFGMFRYPEKYLALFWAGMVPAVALGFDEVRKLAKGWSMTAWLGAVGLAIAAAALWRFQGVAALWAWRGHPLNTLDPARLVIRRAWAVGLLESGGVLAFTAIVLKASTVRPGMALLLPIIVFAELLNGNHAHLPMVSSTLITNATPFAEIVRSSAVSNEPAARVSPLLGVAVPNAVTFVGNRWVSVMRDSLRPDDAGRDSVSSLGFNLPGTSGRAAMLFGPGARRASKLGPMFNTCFRVVPASHPFAPGEHLLLANTNSGVMLIDQACRPRAFITATVHAESVGGALATVTRGLPRMTTVWEGGPVLPLGRGSVEWVSYKPEHIALDATSDVRTGLFLADEYAPGWEAHVDGVKTEIFAADVDARGIVLPIGRHRITFDFHTPYLKWGMALSLVGAAMCAVLIVFGAGRKHELKCREHAG